MSKGFGEVQQSGYNVDLDGPTAAERLMISRDDPLQVKLKLGPGSRIVIPAEVRAAMELKEGDTLIGSFDGETLTLTAFHRLVREIQKEMTALVPRNVSVVDEFIAEKRAEAAREDAKYAVDGASDED